MVDYKSSIFRKNAVQNYIRGQEKAVLPQLVAPRVFLYLWSLLGLLAASGTIASCIQIPTFITGSAIIVRRPAASQDSQAEVVVIALFPAQSSPPLKSSRFVLLRFDGLGSDRIKRPIVAANKQVLSPKDIQQQWGLENSITANITQPVRLVVTPLEPIPTTLPSTAYIGSVGHAEIEGEGSRIISFLPGVHQFLKRKLKTDQMR
ncbi:MAG: hypothetical protein QNJ63_28115 [Calothrix sp. MO_192.B10]|nr:hypothetical protein [Calothrix sp. MO_192.B10]